MTHTRPSSRHRGVAQAVVGTSGLLVGLGLGLLVMVNGCEESSTPPPTNQQQGGGLSQNPTSLLGRSAKTGKDIAQQAENKQAEAAGMADEMSGAAGTYEVAGLSWKVPSSWTKVPPASNMLVGEFKASGDSGDVRVTVSHFQGGAGGSIDMNVRRWEGQFRDAAGGAVVAHPTKRTVAGCPVTLVTLEGTMKGGGPGAPASDTPDMAMHGALIEGPAGLVVFKITGSKEAVDAVAADWETMINGMTKKGS